MFRARFLRLFFHLLYHPFAWTYDWVAATVSLGMWNDWILAVLPALKGPRILELGYGPGHLQAALLQAGAAAWGLDRSPQMGRLAHKQLVHQGLTPRLVNGAAQALPFPADSFEQVVATFPSEYIADPHTLAEIHRVLAPGGELVVLLVAWITGHNLMARAARLLFRITGQAPHLDEEALARGPESARELGFVFRVEHITLEASELLVIHARK